MSRATTSVFPWGELASHAAEVRGRVSRWPSWKQAVHVSRAPQSRAALRPESDSSIEGLAKSGGEQEVEAVIPKD